MLNYFPDHHTLKFSIIALGLKKIKIKNIYRYIYSINGEREILQFERARKQRKPTSDLEEIYQVKRQPKTKNTLIMIISSEKLVTYSKKMN